MGILPPMRVATGFLPKVASIASEAARYSAESTGTTEGSAPFTAFTLTVIPLGAKDSKCFLKSSLIFADDCPGTNRVVILARRLRELWF